jgi:hypothetical protein
VQERIGTDDVPYHGLRYSVSVALAPLSVLVLVPERTLPASLRR